MSTDRPNPWSHTYWPREQHEYMLALVRKDHGDVLPEWAIFADLVFLADLAQHPTKPQAFPGRRRLEARWGVSERVARRCLADPSWQVKCDLAKVRLPERKTDGPMGERPRSRTHTVPGPVPTASPVVSPLGTSEADDSADTVPGGVPGGVPGPVPTASPVTSTGVEIGPTVLRSPVPRIEQHTPAPPVVALALLPVPESRPTRARKPRRPAGVTAEQLPHVLRALEAIRKEPPDPVRCKTEAAMVLGLWKAQGEPPIEQLADELCLVARWAQTSRDPLAMNDIRGTRPDGKLWGTDRSTHTSTLCAHGSFSARLAAARRWSGQTVRRAEVAAAERDDLGEYTTAAEVEADLRTWCDDEALIAAKVAEWVQTRRTAS